MQTTDATYQALLVESHTTETRLRIGDTSYGESKIMENSLVVKHALFSGETPSVGGAVAGEIEVGLRGVTSSDVSRRAELRPEVRLVSLDGQTVSEWIAQGVYNVDKRSYNKQTGVLTLHGYDKMLATEQWYTGSVGSGGAVDIDIVNRVCTQVGIALDSETASFFSASGKKYKVTKPRNYTCRELLQAIAGWYGGNWCMTPVGKLRLVLLNSLPKETNYLVDNGGNAIKFGGDRILVG